MYFWMKSTPLCRSPSAVLHGDDLQASPAAGLQPLAQRVEIDRPVFLAHRLEHLDRGDAVIGPALVAVVLQLDLHPVRQPGAAIRATA
jgi:hypothetical protein